MDVAAAIDDAAAAAFVSTGHLPPSRRVRDLLGEAHARSRDDDEGLTSDVYPGLRGVPPDLFGICLAAWHILVEGAASTWSDTLVVGAILAAIGAVVVVASYALLGDYLRLIRPQPR